MKPLSQAIKALEDNGYVLKRHGKKHDIYVNGELQCAIPLKRHDFDESDLRYILREIRANKEG